MAAGIASREYLEQVKCCNDTDCMHRMMKQGFLALKSGDWDEYKGIFSVEVKAAEWAFDRIKEPFEKVAKDEARKLSIVQEIVIRSTDYLRRIISPGSKETLRCHTCAPQCTSFPSENCVWWVSGGKTYKLVVCDLWRKMQLEATKQAFGGANRRRC